MFESIDGGAKEAMFVLIGMVTAIGLLLLFAGLAHYLFNLS